MSSVDVFGRYLQKSKQCARGPPGIGYKLTTDGNYDIDKKRLCNIADPDENSDACSLKFLIKVIQSHYSIVQADLKQINNTLSTTIKNNETKIDTLQLKVNPLEQKLDSLESITKRLTRRLMSLETRFDALTTPTLSIATSTLSQEDP